MRARAEWRKLLGRHRAVLGDVEAHTQRIDLGPDKGVYHRVQAGRFATVAAARDLCAAIRESTPKQACLVVPAQ